MRALISTARSPVLRPDRPGAHTIEAARGGPAIMGPWMTTSCSTSARACDSSGSASGSCPDRIRGPRVHAVIRARGAARLLRFEPERGWTGPDSCRTVAGRRRGPDRRAASDRHRPGRPVPGAGTELGVASGAVAAANDAPTVLNLFATRESRRWTAAQEGASVVHVDAARPTVAWARRNAELSGLADRPIRWIVDDAAAFVAREVRRGHHYAGIVLDPPSYGHGEGRRAWRMERDLAPLLRQVAELVTANGVRAADRPHPGLRPRATRRRACGAVRRVASQD